MLTATSIIDKLVDNIAAARVDEQPSPNIYIEDVFDPPTYTEILSRLPKREAYAPLDHPDARLPDGTATRLLLDLSEQSIARIQPEDQDFWVEMKDVFTSDALLNAVTKKFQRSITEQLGTDWPEMVTVPIFYKDFPGYFIRVHEDSPIKVATLQFYLPSDESQVHLGTSFHEKTANGFELLKTNSFRPNSGYAFVRTSNSWHSVKQMGANEKERNTLALTIYIKGKEYKPPPQQ